MKLILVVSTKNRFKHLMDSKREQITTINQTQVSFQTADDKKYQWCPDVEATRGTNRGVEVHVYPAGMEPPLGPHDIEVLRATHDICGVHHEHTSGF